MKKINDIIVEIAKTVKRIWSRTRPFMFYSVYGKFLTGFTDTATFPKGVYFEGVDKWIVASGGSAGQDNGFQMFERAIGINYDGAIKHMQKHIREGISTKRCNQIEFIGEHSKIR